MGYKEQAGSDAHLDEFGQSTLLQPGLIEGLLVGPPGGLLPHGPPTPPQIQRRPLPYHSQRYLPILLIDLGLLPQPFLVDGHRIPLLRSLLPPFRIDYLPQQYLVIHCQLCKILLGVVGAGEVFAFIEEAHVVGGC